MPANRLPWIKLWRELMENEKIRHLSDGQYRTWTYCLLAGNQQPVRWRFDSLEHAAYVTRRPMKDLKELAERRFLEVRPDGVWIHDAKHWQEVASMTASAREQSSNTDGTLTEAPANTDGTLTERVPNVGLEGEGEGEGDIEEDVERDVTPLTPRRGKRAKPAHEVLSMEDEEFLVDKWAEKYGDRQEVREEIAAALNNNSRLKCHIERLYVDNWLRRGWTFRSGRRQNGTTLATVECSCERMRASLAVSPDWLLVCEVHGRVLAA
jgi:hypothetical protein